MFAGTRGVGALLPALRQAAAAHGVRLLQLLRIATPAEYRSAFVGKRVLSIEPPVASGYVRALESGRTAVEHAENLAAQRRLSHAPRSHCAHRVSAGA